MTKEYEIYFPHNKIREQQKEALDFVTSNIDQYKYFILELPTGVGKSAIAVTLSRWIQNHCDFGCSKGSYILTTQKILQEQYQNEFSGIVNVWSKSNYECLHRSKVSCEEGLFLNRLFQDAPESKKCSCNCIYQNTFKDFITSPIGITNVAYMLNQLAYNQPSSIVKRSLLVVDECHNLEQSIVDFAAIKISKTLCEEILRIDYPDNFNTIYEYFNWIKETFSCSLTNKIKELDKEISSVNPKNAEFKALIQESTYLNQIVGKVIVFIEDESDLDNWVLTEYENYFEIKPIYAGKFSNKFLFYVGHKVLLMSGTILDKDTFCRNLGISKESACFLSLPSPFPKENRCVFYCPVGNMNHSNIKNTLPNMSESIFKIINQHKGQKGIIHTHTYNIAQYIKERDKTKRLLLHDTKNRHEILKQHILSDKDTILLSPSFTEGVDLIQDLSRFQIICKIPFPFLQDHYIKTKMERCQNWYQWQTAKTIIQALGRSIRSPTDQAVSYILDSSWEYFYKRNNFLFPQWFKDSIIFV